jgi:hypothetical protein
MVSGLHGFEGEQIKHAHKQISERIHNAATRSVDASRSHDLGGRDARDAEVELRIIISHAGMGLLQNRLGTLLSFFYTFFCRFCRFGIRDKLRQTLFASIALLAIASIALSDVL